MKIELKRFFTLALCGLALNSSAEQPAATGSFLLAGSLTQFRRLHTATLLPNGQVLVAGGAPIAPAAISEIFDPVAQTWRNSGTLNEGREFHTATLLPDGSVMVVAGQ